jgi:hypothetical protein
MHQEAGVTCRDEGTSDAWEATIGDGPDMWNPLGAMKSSTIATAIDAITVAVSAKFLIISTHLRTLDLATATHP